VSDGLDEIERLCSTLLRRVSAGERRAMLRDIARQVRAYQLAHLRAQKEPDGTAFTPRRPKRPEQPGGYTVKFLYPKGAADPRLVLMKSWVRQGALITGYDIEAGGIRSFFWDKIDRWLEPAEGERVAGGTRLRRKGRIRAKAMFRKLGRQLKTGVPSADEAWVGWIGGAARVAAIHHEGASDRPALGGRPVRYARRILLGLSTGERSALVDTVLVRLAG